MTLIEILGITLSIFFSLFGLIIPKATANFLGFKTESAKGDIEIMATYGGFFMGLALVTLIVNTPEGFDILGGAYIGAGVIRIIALLKYQKLLILSAAIAVAEATMGGLLIFF